MANSDWNHAVSFSLAFSLEFNALKHFYGMQVTLQILLSVTSRWNIINFAMNLLDKYLNMYFNIKSV